VPLTIGRNLSLSLSIQGFNTYSSAYAHAGSLVQEIEARMDVKTSWLVYTQQTVFSLTSRLFFRALSIYLYTFDENIISSAMYRHQCIMLSSYVWYLCLHHCIHTSMKIFRAVFSVNQNTGTCLPFSVYYINRVEFDNRYRYNTSVINHADTF
jgi:hypothetical protein